MLKYGWPCNSTDCIDTALGTTGEEWGVCSSSRVVRTSQLFVYTATHKRAGAGGGGVIYWHFPKCIYLQNVYSPTLITDLPVWNGVWSNNTLLVACTIYWHACMGDIRVIYLFFTGKLMIFLFGKNQCSNCFHAFWTPNFDLLTHKILYYLLSFFTPRYFLFIYTTNSYSFLCFCDNN